GRVQLAIIYRIDLILVFLDTFLSHLLWNTGDGGWYRAELYAGAEYFDAMGGYTSPCRRGYAKLLATTNMESKYKPKVRPRITDLINATIISMYREHLLSIDSGRAQKLLYQVVTPQTGAGPTSPKAASLSGYSLTSSSQAVFRTTRRPGD
ncbi:hypothetical protein DFH06DRAFT_980329, partial [Mycena polygramma]